MEDKGEKYMKEITTILKELEHSQKSKITNERQAILKMFEDEINKERINTKYKPITGRAVAMKCSHLKDNFTLYYFHSQCLDYKNRKGSFSKCFFGSLKINK